MQLLLAFSRSFLTSHELLLVRCVLTSPALLTVPAAETSSTTCFCSSETGC